MSVCFSLWIITSLYVCFHLQEDSLVSKEIVVCSKLYISKTKQRPFC